MTEPTLYRAFVAMSGDLRPWRAHLEGLQAWLSEAAEELHLRSSWSNLDQLHLTLKFLGNAEPETLRSLHAELLAACAGFGPIDLGLAKLSAFPRPRAARVLVVQVSDFAERLSELARRVETVASTLGFAAETRPFRPHLTLARLRYPQDVRKLFAKASSCEGPRCEFRAITIVRSVLHKRGAEHTPLYEIPLAAAG